MIAERTSNVLTKAIADRTAHVCVVGLGYVGLPLAVEIAKAGFETLGYDVSATTVSSINRGTSTVMDVPDEDVRRLVDSGSLMATSDAAMLSDADVVVVCVPTPLRGNKEPDMRFVEAAIRDIAHTHRPGRLIVLESTSYPGTTDELVAAALREHGAEIDVDTFLAFSPERVDPGNSRFKTKNIPKVVGGVGPASSDVATCFYGQFIDELHPVSSARVAETAKLLENTFRAVNIAMINEFAQLCHELHVDVWEVIEAAKTKPFGFMPFYPGPGVGGHCIPLDPHYLAWSARLTGFEPRFIHIADQVNSTMPRYVVTRLAELLNDMSRSLRGSNVLVFGVSYKADVADARESPALEVMHLLGTRGANVRYIDPYVPCASFKSDTWTGSPMSEDTLNWADAAVVLASHTAFDWPSIVQDLRCPVLDTRNAVRPKFANVVTL